jgi:DNA helicase-2/ATP-dependent DNA helicase PcrA
MIACGEEDFSIAPRSVLALTGFLKLLDELIEQSKKLNLEEFFDLLLDKTGYREYALQASDGQDRWENILELRTVASGYGEFEPEEGLDHFLEEVALVSDVDDLDERGDAVTLITLHQAKGLELPVVFIVGLEENVLPHFRSMPDTAQMEEERRLFYVGITRAKEKVYLVHAMRRSLMGTSAHNPPSRFLQDIPTHLIETPYKRMEEMPYLVRQRIPAANKEDAIPFIPSLKAGDHVNHAIFGEGIVVNSVPAAGDQEITIAFKGDAGIKRFLLSLAPLKKLSEA